MKKIDVPTIIVWGSAVCGGALILAVGDSHTAPKPHEYPAVTMSGALLLVVLLQPLLWVARFWWPNFVARIFKAGFEAAKILVPAFLFALIVAWLFEPPERSSAEICSGLTGRELDDCVESFDRDPDDRAPQ